MPNSHKCVLYGLSTCIHCKHCIQFLKDRNVDFEIHFVDKENGVAREKLIEAVKTYNPRLSFPTVVIDDGNDVVVGFDPEALTKALEL